MLKAYSLKLQASSVSSQAQQLITAWSHQFPQIAPDGNIVPSDFSLRFPFPREVRFNRWGSFFELFSFLFFARKIDAAKTHFFPQFWRFLAIFAPKMGDLGSILGAWGKLFVTILLIESKLHFFHGFSRFFARFLVFQHICKNTVLKQGSL